MIGLGDQVCLVQQVGLAGPVPPVEPAPLAERVQLTDPLPPTAGAAN